MYTHTHILHMYIYMWVVGYGSPSYVCNVCPEGGIRAWDVGSGPPGTPAPAQP